MSYMDKILKKSEKYKFYKTNYSKLKKENKKVKNRLKVVKSHRDRYLHKKRVSQRKLGKFTRPLIMEKLINEDYSNLTIAIKSPNQIKQAHWGDLFFARSLKKSFEKMGFNVIHQQRDEWYDDVDVDIAIVLRGLINYEPNFEEINLMWNISHPDMIKIGEYGKYDIVFVASQKYAEILDEKANTNVECLLQCTDPDVFYTEKVDGLEDDILFVGASRGVYRRIVKDVIETQHDVSVYGNGWEEFLDEEYLKGEFIENVDLHKYYSSCKILLNDHWDDMNELDFPSNRLFDALACGTFVISDDIPAAETVFKDCLVTYKDSQDLDEKINYYLTNEKEREEIANRGKEMVLKEHTFDKRAEAIISSLKNLEL